MTRFARACLYTLAGSALLGLVGCSAVSNGYGGWYWQMPQLPLSASSTPVAMNNTNSNSAAHVKSDTAGQNNNQKG